MPFSFCHLTVPLCAAVALCSTGVHATQYVYNSSRDAGMQPGANYVYSSAAAPSASNNYASVPGTSPYPNPYQVPAATATSYKPVSVPGSGQYAPNAYPPVSETPPAPVSAPPTTSYQPVSVPGTDSGYQPAAAPPVAPQPMTATRVYPGDDGFQTENRVTSPPASGGAPLFDPTYRGVNETPALQAQHQPLTSTTLAYGETSSSLSQLPHYSYDPDLDPKNNPPYRAPTESDQHSNDPAWHPYFGLETRSGLDLGAGFGYYRYDEPDASVSEIGNPIDLDVKGTVAYRTFFASADIGYTFGNVDYNGTGTLNDTGMDSFDVRGLFGKDFNITREYSLSPYVGIGYRTLFNDIRGVTSDGSIGYRRYNQLYYLPIGVYPRTHIDSNARLVGSFEYDMLLHGNQKTYLADINVGDPNVNNGQSSGYGLRGDIMYETKSWSIGPFFKWWSIDESKTKNVIDHSASTCFPVGGPPCLLSTQEPANHTFEAGIQFKYHLF